MTRNDMTHSDDADASVANTRRGNRGRHSARRTSGPSRRARLGRALLIAVLVVGIGVAAAFAYVSWRSSQSLKDLETTIRPDTATSEAIAREVVAPPANQRFEYILLLGDDRLPGQTRGRTDTIILVAVDRKTGDAAMISIPRDTRLNVPGHGMTKVNHAGAYGGAALSIKTVSAYTGLPINHYIRIDFDGLQSLINLLGGVDVFDQKTGKVHHLDGRLAVSFVRQRKIYASGDFARMDNQQRVLMQLSKKLKSPWTVAHIPQIVSALKGHLETDMSTKELTALAKKTAGRPITSIVLTGTTGRMDGLSYVFPDEALKNRIFSALKAGRLPEKN